jgi:sec-independent protein translocase protein TatC
MAERTSLDDGRMPFFEHLQELRDRLRNAVIAFVIGFVGCWFFAERIYDWLRVPMNEAWLAHADQLGKVPQLAFAKPTEPFWVYMSTAMWAGIFVSSPFIFYQLWRFVAPGLYKTERKLGMWFACLSAVFFVAGALFCHEFVLRVIYTFLLGYAKSDIHPQIMMGEYLDMTRNLMLAFGAVFELPLLIYFLARVGLVTHRGLWRFNRWFIVLAFIIGAVLTPPDVASQVMMSVPLVLLYNVSILVALVVTRGREKAQAEKRGKEREAEARLRARRAADAAARAAAGEAPEDDEDDEDADEDDDDESDEDDEDADEDDDDEDEDADEDDE